MVRTSRVTGEFEEWRPRPSSRHYPSPFVHQVDPLIFFRFSGALLHFLFFLAFFGGGGGECTTQRLKPPEARTKRTERGTEAGGHEGGGCTTGRPMACATGEGALSRLRTEKTNIFSQLGTLELFLTLETSNHIG